MDIEDVYHKYSKDVFRFCLSLCGSPAIADDMTSETFLKAIKSCEGFRGQCSVKAWLLIIAKNTYYDYLRKHKKFAALSDDIPCENEMEREFLDKDEAFRIDKLLRKLAEPYQEVFSLRVYAELPFADIGRMFAKSESWARVTYHRARLKLKEDVFHEGM